MNDQNNIGSSWSFLANLPTWVYALAAMIGALLIVWLMSELMGALFGHTLESFNPPITQTKPSP